jgi:hypothetical protein
MIHGLGHYANILALIMPLYFLMTICWREGFRYYFSNLGSLENKAAETAIKAAAVNKDAVYLDQDRNMCRLVTFYSKVPDDSYEG